MIPAQGSSSKCWQIKCTLVQLDKDAVKFESKCMIPQFWFGVAGSSTLSKTDLTETWWCLPPSAEVGDLILLYCPRSASLARHGVFAEAKVLSPVSKTRSENCNCSGYNARATRLSYVDIQIVERFNVKLTAKQMKNDSLLKVTAPVRSNFQATTFQLDLRIYNRMKSLIEAINDNGRLVKSSP